MTIADLDRDFAFHPSTVLAAHQQAGPAVSMVETWIDVVAHVLDEARTDPELVRTAPHPQEVGQFEGSGLDDPNRWATTWAAWRRNHGGASR